MRSLIGLHDSLAIMTTLYRYTIALQILWTLSSTPTAGDKDFSRPVDRIRNVSTPMRKRSFISRDVSLLRI
jgi:hypothetical protein